ncbi:putative mitochondrial protein, partial [Nicotiana attenuata]
KRTRKFKAKSCLYAAISPTIFSRVMALESAKAIWDFLKEEYQGDERIKGMKKGKGKKNHAGNNQVAANNGGGNNNSSSNKGDKKPDMRCRKCKKLGHAEIICKSKDNQQETEAQVANQQEEEQLFVATCFMGSSSSDSWLIDSGCTNHMTNDETLFRELDRSATSKVKIGNGDYIAVKGKGTLAFETYSGTKTISDVLYVPEIDQNLLSVGQLLQKGFKVIFENQKCLIKDVKDQEVFRVKMKEKSFTLDPKEEEQVAFQSLVSNTFFEPAEYAEAEKDKKWIDAMKEELTMIEKNDTWELVNRPQNRKIIGVKWVYRTKLNADGSVNKHKARLVVKGYAQVFGVDFSETF